jgi:hypothetical protein
MGYQTDFILTVDPLPEQGSVLDRYLQDEFYFSRWSHEYEAESMKWYGYEEDMLALSKDYPDYLFILQGDGEDRGDDWVMYFKGGKHYQVYLHIEVPPFDPELLE